jgi:hypothetical protein
MEYAVQLGSGYVHTKFRKVGSGIQKFLGRIHIHREHELTHILLFVQHKESGLKTMTSWSKKCLDLVQSNVGSCYSGDEPRDSTRIIRNICKLNFKILKKSA